MTIWKYPIPNEFTNLDLPQGATILSTAFQGYELVMWALVEPENPTERRSFAYYMTGQTINRSPFAKFEHLNTHERNGIVFHVFEVTSEI